MNLNPHNAQSLTEHSDTNSVLEDCREINVRQRGRDWGDGDVMKLWSPQTERRLGGISAAPCNNRPLSHWQSLIIQYEEDSSLSPPSSLLRFLFFMSSSAFCTLQFTHAARFSFSLFPPSVSLIPCDLEAEWIPTLV